MDAKERPGGRATSSRAARVLDRERRWLLLDPEKHLPLWAKDDLRRRDIVRDRVLADEEVGEEVKLAIREEAAAEREQVGELIEEKTEEPEEPAAADDPAEAKAEAPVEEPCPT